MAGAPDGDRREVAAIRPIDEEESESEVEVVEGAEGERIRAEREQENIKVMTDPRKPTEKEVELHNLTHLPYRNWCPLCVQEGVCEPKQNNVQTKSGHQKTIKVKMNFVKSRTGILKS